MKKILNTFIFTLLFTSVASADFARIEIGAGAWQQTPSGDVSASGAGLTGKDISLEKEETQAYIWALIKHPIPIIPNLRLEYVDIKSLGEASGSFLNFTAPVGTPTSIEMKQYDVIPYYNILDNTFWISLDLGLDIKVIDTTYNADNVSIGGVANLSYSDSTTIAIPLLYVRARTEIPVTNIGIEADVKYISYNSNTVYDARVKVDYTFDFIPVIQPAIEVGYRVQHIETDDTQDALINLDFKGVYAGVMLRF